MDLATLQDRFQQAFLSDDTAILAALADGPGEPKEVLLGIYRDGYMLRLIEFAQNDHEFLRTYLGDEEFDAMARAYATAHPSHNRNARYFCGQLPEFLAGVAPYCAHPQLAELAALEKALNDAFDATDAPLLTLTALAAVPPVDWPKLKFFVHPSVSRLDFATNAAAIWRALRNDAEPPQPCRLDEPERLLVWRQGTGKFRSLSAEEAMLWDEAAKGANFAMLCEMAAAYDDPDGAPARTAAVLGEWIVSGMLTNIFASPEAYRRKKELPPRRPSRITGPATRQRKTPPNVSGKPSASRRRS